MKTRIIFGAVLIAPLIAFATSSEVYAAKLMRFARWAARETVKTALVEYAKHEAGENFESFRQKFCSDKSYRQKVLSSPAINPLIADQSSAEDLVVETLGCGYSLGKVNVVFTGAVPGSFEGGIAKRCEVKATAFNYSKYHLDQLVVDLDGWKVFVGDMVANAYADIQIPSFDLGEKGKCSYSAQWLNEHAKEAGALQCSIPNMAEGDCQALISVSSAIDAEKIIAVETQVAQEFDKKQAEIKAAASKEMQRNRIYWNKIMKAIVSSPSSKFVSVAVIRPATVTEMKEDFPSGWIVGRKSTLPPCTGAVSASTYFVINDMGRLERYHKLPAIPDGYVVVATGGSHYWLAKMDDLMPYGIYFGGGAIQSCKTTEIGIEITTNSRGDGRQSGPLNAPQYGEMSAIQW
jgi:hypothetical protein